MNAAPTITSDHTAAHLRDVAARMERAAHGAALAALRRVGSEAIRWNRDTGSRIDTRRLAARVGLPGARVFGRVDDGRDRAPDVGLVLLLDDSGSMRASTSTGGNYTTRAEIAATTAAGMARACAALRIPVTVARHDERGEGSGKIRIEVYESTRDMLDRQSALGQGNRDAYAVATFASALRFPAARTVFCLIADGQPTDNVETHRAAARAALDTLRRRRASFLYAYVGDDASDLDRARGDWGADRIADARKPEALRRALVSALADARSQ